MFGSIIKEIKSSFGAPSKGRKGGKRSGGGTRTITVAKPYCTPARDGVMTALNSYGVVIHDFSESTESHKILGKLVPMLQVAEVTVSAQAASWAEYLLLRSGKFRIYGKYQDKRNEAWASRHGGQMPPAWEKGKPYIESGCAAGKEAWRNAKKGKAKK